MFIRNMVQLFVKNYFKHVDYFNATGKQHEAKRLDERVNFDLEMGF